jgi:hypothetical protein
MATLNLTATEDAYFSQYTYPDQNWNTTELRLGDPYHHQFGLQFDISELPSTANVSSAIIYIWATTISASSHIHTNKFLSTFDETTITFNNRPSLGALEQDDLNTTLGWKQLDVTNLIASSLGDSTFGANVRKDYGGLSLIFSSSEVSGKEPYLSITYTATNFYVKTDGNDANDGESWANAWATINKAATTVLDGSTVHIGFGTYNTEPVNNDIAPVNAGAVGIKYLPETATTGGGTGSVIVEVN